MDMYSLRKERISLFKDTITGNNPKRIPNFGNLWSWKYYDAGYKLSDALYSYDIIEKSLRNMCENYKIDAVYEYGWRNPVQVLDVLGNDEYEINDEDHSLNIHDQCFMEQSEYDDLIKNPKKYLWETFLPRKAKYLKNKNNLEVFRNFLGKFGEFGATIGNFTKILEDDYGLADLFDPNGAVDNFGNGIEFLFNNLRGIKGLSVDLRRCPDKVEAAIEALNETFLYPRMERAKSSPKGSNPDFCVDMNPVMFAHTILNPKQFEKFYWPHFKRIADFAEEYDKIIYIFAEGLSEHIYEFFQEFPRNRFAIHVEENDIFEFKKKVTNVTVAGGFPTTLLGNGTPEECIDYVKKLIDELAFDKHYIFSEDKMISFPKDCKRENLKAICDFLADFRY